MEKNHQIPNLAFLLWRFWVTFEKLKMYFKLWKIPLKI